MKLLRYGPSGREKPGLLDANGQIRDLSSLVPDISGDTISPAGLKRLSEIDPATLPVVEGNPRLGPCVSGLQKILCIGLNYSDHAAETGSPLASRLLENWDASRGAFLHILSREAEQVAQARRA